MKFTSSLTALALSAIMGLASASPVALEARATPTIYLIGDSTMAKGGGGSGTNGWGEYLGNFTTGATVVNKAIAGRSARSYTDEGRFDAVLALVQAGDVVVVEFGHNDGGTPATNDNARSDCPGDGTETCVSSSTGATVYTFVYYVSKAAKAFIAKGATVVLSSQTPNNLWETGAFVPSAPRFVAYQKTAAAAIGTGASFVDHFQAQAAAYKKLGATAVDAFYPIDHTHTSTAGALLAAQAFAQAISTKMNGTTSLTSYIKSGIATVY